MNYGKIDTSLRLFSILAIIGGGLWLIFNGFADKTPAPTIAGPAPASDLESVTRIHTGIEPVSWKGILLYHSGFDEDTPRDLKARFAENGFKRLPFHFLITSGGSLFATLNWRQQRACDQAVEPYFARTHIAICVLGNFSLPESRPDAGQFDSLKLLVRYLQAAKPNRIPKVNIIPAHEVQSTESPGENFPWKEFRRALR